MPGQNLSELGTCQLCLKIQKHEYLSDLLHKRVGSDSLLTQGATGTRQVITNFKGNFSSK